MILSMFQGANRIKIYHSGQWDIVFQMVCKRQPYKFKQKCDRKNFLTFQPVIIRFLITHREIVMLFNNCLGHSFQAAIIGAISVIGAIPWQYYSLNSVQLEIPLLYSSEITLTNVSKKG